MRWIVALSVFVLVFGLGCSDEKKKQRSKEKTEGSVEQQQTSDKEAEPVSESTKSKDSAPKVQAPAKAATPASAGRAVAATNGGLWGLNFGSDAILAVGIQNFDGLYDLVSKKIKKYRLGVPMMSPEVLLAQAQQIVGTSNMAWLDRKKSIKIVAWNPKKSSDMIYMVPITSKEAMVGALPKTSRAGEDGNSFTLTIEGRQLFINFVDEHAVVCFDSDLFDQAKPFLSKMAREFQPTGLIEARISVTNLKRVYNTEVTMGLAMLSSIKGQLLQEDLTADERKMLGEFLDSGIAIARAVVSECEGLRVVVDIPADGNATLALAAQASAGGTMAGFSSALASAKLDPIANAPQNSWMVTASDLTGLNASGMSQKAIRNGAMALAKMLELNDADNDRLTKMLATLESQQDGLTWVALYPDKQFPAGFLLSSNASDGKRYGQTMQALLRFFYEKGFDSVRGDLPPALQTLPSDDFAQFVKSISDMVQPMGLTLKTRSEEKGDTATHSLALVLDAEKASALDPSNADNIRQLTKAFGTQFELSLANGSGGMVIAVGPTAGSFASQSVSADAPKNREIVDVLEKAPKGTGVIVFAEAGRAFRLFQPIVKVFNPEQLKALETLPADARFLLTVSGEGTVSTLKVSVPLDAFVMLGVDFYQFSTMQ